MPALLVLYAVFGSRIVTSAVVTTCMTPLLMLSTALGLRVGTQLGRQRLRRTTLALLLLTGAAGLAAPILSVR